MPATAVVISSEDTFRQEVVVDGRHTVTVDEPESLGGTDTAPTPYELMAASLAACVAITLRMYARRKGWELGEFTVDACMDREDRPQKCTVTLTLPDGVSEEQAARLRRIAHACPVSKMLQEGFEVEHLDPVGST